MEDFKFFLEKMEKQVKKESYDNSEKMNFINNYKNELPMKVTITKACKNTIFICC